MHKKVILFLAVVAAILAVAVPAAQAWPSHSSYVSTSTGWSTVRSCPSTGCTPITYLYNGSSVWMLCWRDSQWAYGNYWSPRWFFVWFGGTEGWVHSSLVYNQAVAPNC